MNIMLSAVSIALGSITLTLLATPICPDVCPTNKCISEREKERKTWGIKMNFPNNFVILVLQMPYNNSSTWKRVKEKHKGPVSHGHRENK